MLILSESDVKKSLDLKRCLEANRSALRGVFTQQAVVPSRVGIPFGTSGDWSLFKPAASSDNKTLGIKVVSVRSQNPANGLPMVPATILHMNPVSGMVEAVVSGTYLTGARTAAGSALTVQLFKSCVDHLVLFGAGLQARLHVECIRAALDEQLFGRITIINRSSRSAETLQQVVEPWAKEGVRIVLSSNTEDVAKSLATADVICTCTGSATPLWPGSTQLREDCIITGVGSYTPDQCEVPLETVKSCETIYIDTNEAKSVGDLKEIFSCATRPEIKLLGELLGAERSTVKKATGRVFFKSVGTAIQDVLTAREVVERAKLQGLGTPVDMN